MLSTILKGLDQTTQQEFIAELNQVVSSKMGGLEFNISEKDIHKSVEDAPATETEKQAQADAKQKTFIEATKKYGQSGPGGDYGGVNVIEM
jgi:t-SNARE complex subunit (syntaxin)